MLNIKRHIDGFINDFETKTNQSLPNSFREYEYNRDWEEDRYACCMDSENVDFFFLGYMKDRFLSGCVQY